jgi:hypothetical protein
LKRILNVCSATVRVCISWATWFETHGFAALLTMRISDLILEEGALARVSRPHPEERALARVSKDEATEP